MIYRVGDRAIFDDPDYGPRTGVVSAVYPDGSVELAVSMGARESRSLCYTVPATDPRLSKG